MGLELKNVSKSYSGKKVVDNLNFSIEKPGVFGLLGSNGAGKTTTIRMMLGIINKDEGEISWNGKPVKRENVNFGYLPEERGIYPKTLLFDQFMYFARLKGMKKDKAKVEIEYWAKKLGLEEYLHKPAEQLSKGNQQKVQLILAILHKPDLLVLDEPFSGLDPVNTQIIKGIIEELISNNTYIVMSSHQMPVVEEYCRDILLLNKGKTLLQGNLEQIKNNYGSKNILIETADDISKIIAKEKIIEQKVNSYEIAVSSEEMPKQFLKTLVDNNVNVKKFEIKTPSLHQIFIDKVGE
ncbi:MAG: ATP-binding cassette domain-containing protein [Lachnospiraceae bacterium]|jgi:ABC-2 type transport system ATP-binding protein|nr:ATP-binding cassette domain-containing protein [Lachnospiraceae bacterium]